VDNVVAAVAMSPKLWVVCTGVFIGILALRFVAGACIRLIEKFPILEHTAFVLVGYVGFILVYELLSDPHSGIQILPGPVHVTTWQKFIGIVLIIGVSIFYMRSALLRDAMRPLLRLVRIPMNSVAALVGFLLKILFFPFRSLVRLVKPA
jgi:tellurite resistance protein TerC